MNKSINKTRTEIGQGSTIKLLVGILLCLFLVQFASAELFTFDNYINYSKGDMKIDIINTFGLGTNYGSLELKSHKTPTEVLGVMPGENRAVMYYEFTNWKDVYTNGLGEVTFKDVKTGKIIDKDYYFAKQVLEPYEVNDYKEVCKKNTINKTGGEICNNVLSGTHTEYKTKWEKLNNKDIPKEKITIALITDVGNNDYVDGVWTIAGKKIDKHASWTATLNTNLISYWNFNTDGTDTTAHSISCTRNRMCLYR
jgi:hypothetical protein